MSRLHRHLLLIAHHFPPAASAAVMRPLKFAKFLPRHGWRVTVLTTQAELLPGIYGFRDPSLLEELPPEVNVLRAPCERLGRPPPRRTGILGLDRLRWNLWSLLNGPDTYTSWHKSAYPAAIQRASEVPFSAVLATSGPHSSQLLGRRLARKLRVPFVADFRDPWGLRDWPPDWRPTPHTRRWERKVLRAAARVVVVTGAMHRLYAKAYPSLAPRFSVIENGVDLEEPGWREPAAPSREHFEIVYTGLFYSNRRPDALFRTLALARERSAAFRTRARFVMVGTFGVVPKRVQSARRLIESLALVEAIKETSWLPHTEAVRLQRAAGALVLIQQPPLAAASKSYEYVAAGRPILALVPHGGEAERVLSRGVMTVFADPEDPESAAEVLLDLFGRWERRELSDLPAPEVPAEYTRAHQAKQLAELLDAAVAEPTEDSP